MKDAFDIIKDIRSLINVQAVTSLLTGAIWSDFRPDNRQLKSDIVVNSLGITNTQMQVGFANVNVYVPKSQQTIDGVSQLYPDQAKMLQMGKLLVPLLETQWRDTFHTEVEDPGTTVKDTDGSYFISIRVKYYSVQDNYKNI
jgi:beta-galactosidase/beta-glucuronidase